ncbi:winged helix domain-containing protein [Aliiroseovarius sp. YM-037]|uniref:winged helix domain-containing protein n=1 Tax=Aliiroseovarius sp. YM-037 TaxID=3341728 RepID=UPI003A805E49
MRKPSHKWARKTCVVTNNEKPIIISISGRELWMLLELDAAGSTGCTALQYAPGIRLAAYVYKLRKRGVEIATYREPNDGSFPGTHGRYVLMSQIAWNIDTEVRI